MYTSEIVVRCLPPARLDLVHAVQEALYAEAILNR